MWKTKATRMHMNAPIMASGLSTGHSLMRLRQEGESETFCKQGTGSSHNAIFRNYRYGRNTQICQLQGRGDSKPL